MFSEENDQERTMPSIDSCYELRQKLHMVAPMQWDNDTADREVATIDADYWGRAFPGLLRMMKQAKFGDRQTHRVLAGIANLMQGQSYSGDCLL